MNKMTALVVGGTGLAGAAIVKQLGLNPEWDVVVLARQVESSTFPTGAKCVSADLYDLDSLKMALRGHDISHIFYAAHYSGTNNDEWLPKSHWGIALLVYCIPLMRYLSPILSRVAFDQYYEYLAKMSKLSYVSQNLTMFKNCLSAVSQTSTALEHVCLLTGGRYYGHHLGPALYPEYKSPATEDQACMPGSNWYRGVEEHLLKNAQALGYSWNIIRPTVNVGYSSKTPFNLALCVAVYASQLKCLGLPLLFPSSESAYHSKLDFVATQDLAKLCEWSALRESAQNEVFNAATGEGITWKQVWAIYADFFDMEIEGPKTSSIQRQLPNAAAEWSAIVKEYQLQDIPFSSLCDPTFLNKVLLFSWDVEYSMDKAHKFGFTSERTCERIISDFLIELQSRRVIPTFVE